MSLRRRDTYFTVTGKGRVTDTASLMDLEPGSSGSALWMAPVFSVKQKFKLSYESKEEERGGLDVRGKWKSPEKKKKGLEHGGEN